MKFILLLAAIFFACFCFAQDENTLLKQADNLEKQFKDNDALNVYEQVLSTDKDNINVLIKCVEINSRLGESTADKRGKINYYNAAKTFADKAFAVDSNSSAANYAQALVYGKLIETDEENKKIVFDARQIYMYGSKALLIDPNNAKANYVLGKWNLKSVSLSWYKRAAVNAIYGKMPEANIDSAIACFVKSIRFDMYFSHAYLDLASAYEFVNKPLLEIDILKKLIKLPNRVSDDAMVKAKGEVMLSKLQ